MTKLAFVDCETTGLDPERHEMWELAVIVRDGGNSMDGEWTWHLPVNLAKADPMALSIGRFYERRRRLPGWNCVLECRAANPARWRGTTAKSVASQVANLLDGAHIVGAVPSFDTGFLRPWLRANGHAACWHYHLITVEALAIGYLAGMRHPDELPALAPPWKSDELSRAILVAPPSDEERHTALGDARWAMRMYDGVMGT